MTLRKQRQQGLELTPENIQGGGGNDLSREGEISTDSSDSELKVRLNSATRTIVTEDQTQVLTNKTIDADLNTIVDLEVDNLKSGVLNVSITLSGASDAQLPSALAVKTYIDDKAAAQNEASEISVVPAGTIAATNVQAALEELDTDIQNHLNDATDAHDASAISNIPSGNLAATDVQAALNELQSDIDTKSSSSDLTTHVSSTAAHGATGAVVGTTNTQTLTNKTLTSPVINSPTGLVKADVGLSNVDNTSDATKDAATATLTNKTLTAPVINSPTGLVKADVGLGNVDNTSDATKNSAVATLTNKTITGASIQTPSRLDPKNDTKANLITYALTATNGQLVYATDTKESFTIKDGLLSDLGGGGSGVGGTDILSADQADKSALTDYTQTGLEIIETPIVLHGTKSFRLQHSSSIKSFKKVIAVDRKFRGKNNTVWIDVASTATNANLNVVFRDETNSVDLTTSQAITTGSQAITATTANASNQLTGMTNAVLNSLKVGMVITGSAIPVGTTITAISTTAATLSQNATGVSTGIRVSALASKQVFSFNIPNNCSSLSWAISSVVEANAESYLDDIVVQLSEFAKTSTSITIPKNNDTDWVSYTPTGVWVANTTYFGKYRRVGDSVQIQARVALSGAPTGTFFINMPPGILIDLAKTPSGAANNTEALGVASFNIAGVRYIGSPFINSTSQLGINTQGSGSSVNATTPATFANGSFIEMTLQVPVQGWTSNETEAKTIELTSAQLVQTPDSSIQLRTGNGFASSFTEVRRFANIVTNIGSDIQYADSPTQGASFTVLTSGVYNISYSDASSGAGSNSITIQKNSTSFSTTGNLGIDSTTGSTVEFTSTSASPYLLAGDVIRFMCGTPGSVGSASGYATVSISKQGSLKQLNISNDSKIVIPTHQLRFEGASARGSTDTAIVKFDTQAITQGDAWTVVNTAANGTVVTMKKAGKLNISTSLYSSGNMNYYITKNQSTTLTGVPTVASEILSYATANTVFSSASASVDVAVGDIIRIVSNVTPSALAGNSLNLSLTENSIPTNFSNVLPQWSQTDSSVRLTTANGYGSTNNKIRRFTNTIDNLGTAITYTDSATLGASFTINEDGNYTISYSEQFSVSANMGITKNASNLTIDPASLAASEILAIATTLNANGRENISVNAYLVKGDVIRAQTGGDAVGSSPSTVNFTISKVGKPNLSSVDVTSFVNLKTTDVEAIESTLSTTFGSTNTAVPILSISKNTNKGIIQVISNSTDGTSFKVLKDCTIDIDSSQYGTGLDNGATWITRNTTTLTTGGNPNNGLVQATNVGSNVTYSIGASIQAISGDIIRVQRTTTAVTVFVGVTLTATADNNATASPTQQVSSDTMSFAFKATAIDPNTDAIGTFNTFTYAAATNTAVLSASAPTQTVSSMNINGIQVFARPQNATSTTASPARVDIFIGKGLKSKQVDAYLSLAKVTPFSYDMMYVNSTIEAGTRVTYDELLGILSINAAISSVATTTKYVDNFTGATNGYFVFNASKSPSLVTIPNLAPRIATIKDVKSAGTSGGTFTSGAWQTRALNTLNDPTGIVTSLASNEFVLPAGTYKINWSAPTYNTVTYNKTRLRNVTDSTDIAVGSSMYGSADSNTVGTGVAVFTITSAKTIRLEHQCGNTIASNGFGIVNTGFSVEEVFSQVEILKIK